MNTDDVYPTTSRTTARRSKIITPLEVLLYLFLFAFCFGSFRPDSIPLRPYMLVTIFFIIYFIFRRVNFIKLIAQDQFIIFFLLIAALGAFSAVNAVAVLEYIVIFLIIFISSLCLRAASMKLSMARVIDIVCRVGIVMIFVTLLYYLLGILSLRFNFNGNNIIANGVLLDRSTPRLISFASNDPNITAFMYSIFVFFFLLDSRKRRKRIGLFFGILLVILTFSRGAIIAYGIAFTFYLLYSNKKQLRQTFKKIFLVVSILGIILLGVNITNSRIIDTIAVRFETSFEDNGSGRIRLWESAIKHFKSHPVLGIGLNNTLEHRDSYSHYVHNTFLEVLAETGIVGLVIYILFLISMCRVAFRVDRSCNDGAFLSLVVCLLIQMFFLSMTADMTLFAVWGLLSSFYLRITSNPRKKNLCLA